MGSVGKGFLNNLGGEPAKVRLEGFIVGLNRLNVLLMGFIPCNWLWKARVRGGDRMNTGLDVLIKRGIVITDAGDMGRNSLAEVVTIHIKPPGGHVCILEWGICVPSGVFGWIFKV